MELCYNLGTGFSAHHNAALGDKVSPLSYSAIGAAYLNTKRYDEAVEMFIEAMAAREKWPPETLPLREMENARDFYLLAMAEYRSSGEPAGTEPAGEAWRLHYERAEALFSEYYSPYMDYADIHRRMRWKARGVLDIDD